MSTQHTFYQCGEHIEAGGEIVRVLPSGRERTLKQIKAGECDCTFPESGKMIVTINENTNDQKFGVWCSAQEDVQATNWRMKPLK